MMITDNDQFMCSFNSMDPMQLFGMYEQAGFLYAEKKAALAPLMPRVIDNWRMAYKSGELLKSVGCCMGSKSGAWASVGAWRTNHNTWNYQHLASSGGLIAARTMLLAITNHRVTDFPEDFANQSWYRPSNRFAQGLFGAVQDVLGVNVAAVNRFAFCGLPRWHSNGGSFAGLRIERVRAIDRCQVYDFAQSSIGRVWANSEELDHEDFELNAIDQLYASVGLRRYRRLWIARRERSDDIVGLAIAYRGPIGFNFSFLENRCHVILSPSLPQVELDSIVRGLLTFSSRDYDDIELPNTPVVVPHNAVASVTAMGGTLIRDYAQSVWLSSSNGAWYRHIEKFYDSIVATRRAAQG